MRDQGEFKPYRPDKEYYFEEGCFINELSNEPDDREVSIARARVECGKITRWHYLLETTERYVIISGNGMVEISENYSARVGPGDVVLIRPGTRQRIRNVGKDDLVFLVVCTPRFNPDNYVDCEN